MRLGDISRSLTRGRDERRRQLTTGERALAWGYVFFTSLLVPVGMVLLIVGSGVAHSVGIALLLAGVIALAVPISPLLNARVRRREARASPIGEGERLKQ